MIPGSNILRTALRIINAQTVSWYRFLEEDTNSIGLKVSKFSDPYEIKGSFQPIARSQFEHLGLDYNKSYVSLYAAFDVEDLQRDIAGDQFEFAGERYQVLSNTEWLTTDGWDASMAVKVSSP